MAATALDSPSGGATTEPHETGSPRTDVHDAPRLTDSMVTVPLAESDLSRHSVPFAESDLSRHSVPLAESDLSRHSVTSPQERVASPDPTMEDAERVQQADEDGSSGVEAGVPAHGSYGEISEEPEMFPGGEYVNVADTAASELSSHGSVSEGSINVDWDELERTEEQEPRDEGSDESTTFLLARLEQENNALATDPKAGLAKAADEESSRTRSQSRPPSIHHLKRLVNEAPPSSLRYSALPSPPAMTELEFYAALVADFPRTAQCLPTLLSKKIRSGIPPPLRGVVWVSMAGARDRLLEEQYERLSGEPSPYENLIGKDIGRSFPGVEMFRDPNGEGQQMLGRVLKCFSLYDHKIGYCQGLGFLVGPLLMHMGEKEAFCVLVRLMEHYDLRSCFLPDLSGLHLRIYQFRHLLAQHLPALSAHLEEHQVEAAYVSQWFLSFFAVTCPLPMLLRIHDVILLEGASETLMRVALSLMRRNEAKILACAEFEDVMQLLLSRGLWDVYRCNADDLVNDFVGLTGVVTHEGLQALEAKFKKAQSEDPSAKASALPDLQAAASRFLGRLWAPSNATTKSVTLSPGLSAPSRPNSVLRRTPSKQSIASTLNSCEGGSEGSVGTVPTEMTGSSRQSSADCTSPKTQAALVTSPTLSTQRAGSKDRDLHGQIEDLLTALGEMQRDQAMLTAELQREREEREEDRKVVAALVDRLRQRGPLETVPEDDHADDDETAQTAAGERAPATADGDAGELGELLGTVERRFSSRSDSRRSSILESKYQLRDELRRWKEQCGLEMSKGQELNRQLAERDQAAAQARDQLKEARLRVQEGHKERQRLEKAVNELRARRPGPTSPVDVAEAAAASPRKPSDVAEARLSAHGGLREFKLNRSSPVFSKRTSSLNVQTTPMSPAESTVGSSADEALLAELVSSKTAEAVARQEAEELRAKLESLRKLFGGGGGGGNGGGGGSMGPPSGAGGGISHRPSPSQPTLGKSATFNSIGAFMSPSPSREQAAAPAATAAGGGGGGGFWGGWGKRSISSSASASES